MMPWTHDELVSRADSWLRNTAKCGVSFTELVANLSTGEQPDAIGFRSGGLSILIECKASKSDFKKDAKKPFRRRPELGVGLYRFIMCPEGLILEEELPEKWGLLYVGPRKSVTRVCGGPIGNVWDSASNDVFAERNTQGEWDLMYSALRRKS